MPYCTIDNIRAYVPSQVWNHAATAPQPSVVDVTAWITEADREIDSKLAGRYAVPITGAESLAIVQSLSARLVAIRIFGLIYAGQNLFLSEDLKQARKDLDAYAAGTYSLPDAGSLGVTPSSAPGSPAGTFPKLEADPLLDVEQRPVFTMGDQF